MIRPTFGGDIAVILACSSVEHLAHPVMVDEGRTIGVLEDLVAFVARAGDIGGVVKGKIYPEEDVAD